MFCFISDVPCPDVNICTILPTAPIFFQDNCWHVECWYTCNFMFVFWMILCGMFSGPKCGVWGHFQNKTQTAYFWICGSCAQTQRSPYFCVHKMHQNTSHFKTHDVVIWPIDQLYYVTQCSALMGQRFKGSIVSKAKTYFAIVSFSLLSLIVTCKMEM